MVWDNGEINWHPQVFQIRVEHVSFGGQSTFWCWSKKATSHLDKSLFSLNKSLLQNESSWLKGLLDRQSVKKFQGHLSFSSSHIYKRLFSLRFAPLYDWPYPSVVGEENISEKLAPSIFYSKSIFSTCSLKGWLVWNDDGWLAGRRYWEHTLDERT